MIYRGAGSIPLSEAIQGWTHIGDPDSQGRHDHRRLPGSSSGVLRVEITQLGACEVDTTVYEYKAA